MGAAGFAFWVSTDGGNAWLKTVLEAEVDRRLSSGDFEIGGLETNLIHRWALTDVRLTDSSGADVIAIQRLDANVSLWGLLSTSPKVSASSVVIHGGRTSLVRDAIGVTNIERMFGKTQPSPPSTEPWKGLPLEIEVEDVQWNGGMFRWATPTSAWGLQGISLRGGFHGQGTDLALQEVSLAAHLQEPTVLPFIATGSVDIHSKGVDTRNFQLSAGSSLVQADGRIGSGSEPWSLELVVAPLQLAVIQKFAPKAAIRESVSGTLKLTGPSSALSIQGDLVPESGGHIHPDLRIDLKDPLKAWSGAIGVDTVQLDRVYDTKGTPILLNGTLTASGHGTKWPMDVEATGRYEGKNHQIREIALDALSGDLKLSKGILAFSEIRAAGPLAALSGAGSLDLVGGDLVVDAKGSIDLEGLDAFDVSFLEGYGPVDVRFSGNVLAPVRSFTAVGRMVIAPFQYEQDVTFKRLELGYRWIMIGTEQTVTGSLEGTDGLAYGVEIPKLTSGDLEVDIPQNREIRVRGPWVATNVNVPSAAFIERMEGTVEVYNPPDKSRRQVTVVADVGNTLFPGDFPGTAGTANVDILGQQVGFDVHLQDGPRELLDVRGGFGLDSRRLTLDDLVLTPTFRQKWRIPQPAQLTLTDGGVGDAQITLQSELGTVVVLGDLGTSGPLQGSIELKDFELEAMAELLPEKFSGYSGQVNTIINASGEGGDPILSGIVAGENVWIPGVSRWLDIRGDFSADRAHVEADLDLGAAGAPLASVKGSIPLHLDLADPHLDTSGGLDARIALVPGTLERLENLTEADLGLPPGRISAVLEAGGTLGDPDFRLSGVTEVMVAGWPEDGRVEFDIERQGKSLAVWADLRQGFASRGQINGTATTRMGDVVSWALEGGQEPDFNDWSLYADDLNVRIAALGTPLKSVLAVAGSSLDARGDLLGGVVITGSPKTPILSGAFNWVNASLGAVPLDGAFVSMVPTTSGYFLDGNFTFAESGELLISGDLPLKIDLNNPYDHWGTGELALVIGGEGFPIGVLQAFDDGIRDTTGVLKVAGTVGGTMLDPAPDLAIELHKGSIGYQPLGVRLEEVELALALDPRRIQLQSFEARTAPLQRGSVTVGTVEATRGRISAKGTSRLKEWRPEGMNFHLDLEKALLSQTWSRLIRLSGPLTAQGNWPELALEGDLKVDQAKIVYSSADGLKSPLEVDSSLAIHRGLEDAGTAKVRVVEPPFYRDFDVDIRVDLNHAVDIDATVPFLDDYGDFGASLSSATAVARLDGHDLHVGMEDGELQLTHTVKISEGSVKLLNGKFDIRDGEVHFNGDPSNPLIDVRATRTLSGGTVTLVVSGPAQSPDFNPVSDEYDQTDIFTILATGRSPEQLSNTGTASAAALVSALLGTSGLLSFRTQVFSLEPDGKLVARIPLPFNRNIEGKLIVDPLHSRDENLYTVGAEAALFGRLRLDLAWGDKLRWADLFVEFRF